MCNEHLPFVVLLLLLLLVTLQQHTAGSAIADERPTHIDRWVSCIGEIVLANADTFRHELNIFTLGGGETEEESLHFEHDLLDRLLARLVYQNAGKQPFTFNLAPYDRTVSYNQRNLVLILLHDLLQLERHLLPQLAVKNVEQRGYFLLLLVPSNATTTTTAEKHVAATFRLLWSVRLHNVVLALERRHPTTRIDLLAYDPYGPGCCGCSRPRLLAHCNAPSPPLYDRFERNLHGCQLRIASFERAPFLEFVHPPGRNGTATTAPFTPKLAGIEGNLVELLAAHLNFRVAIVQPADGRTWGRIYPNGTANGALGLLLNGTVHMTVGGYFPYPALLAATTQTHHYYTAELVLAVPEELATLSPLEQLLKPFQPAIWTVVAVELAIGALGALGALHHRRHRLLHFWRTVIGESLPGRTVPRRTVARLALLLWIVHAALLRESYKGSLVGFLTEPNPLADIHSLEALVQGGYRFAMTETIYHTVFDRSSTNLRPLAPHQVQLIKSADRQALLERTIRSRDRLAFTSTREEIVKFNSRNRTDINYRTSDETLLTFHFAMYFKRSSPIAAACDWYIRRVVATGFVARWHHQHLDLRFERPTLAGSGQAEVLQLHHLHGSYLLLAAGLLLATAIFTLELLWGRWCERRRRPNYPGPYPYLHELRRQYPAVGRRKRAQRITSLARCH